MPELTHEAPPPAVTIGYRLRLVLKSAALAAAVVALFVLAMLLVTDVELTGGYSGLFGATDTALARLATLSVPVGIVCALLVGAGCALLIVRASHKIAGPVYRLTAELRRMAGGEFRLPVATRHSDQLQDLAQELDQARTTTRDRLRRVRKEAEEIARAAARAEVPWRN